MDLVGVALVASAGGTQAIGTIIAALPPDFPGVVVVVQRTDPDRETHVAKPLKIGSHLHVKIAENGDQLAPGCVFVALPDCQLLVKPDGTLSVSEASQSSFWLAGDLLFGSMSAIFGKRAVAVVLTGADQSGSWGVKEIKEVGGRIIAQNAATSIDPSMPRSAIQTGCVDFVLPVEEIAAALMRIARTS